MQQVTLDVEQGDLCRWGNVVALNWCRAHGVRQGIGHAQRSKKSWMPRYCESLPNMIFLSKDHFSLAGTGGFRQVGADSPGTSSCIDF